MNGFPTRFFQWSKILVASVLVSVFGCAPLLAHATPSADQADIIKQAVASGKRLKSISSDRLKNLPASVFQNPGNANNNGQIWKAWQLGKRIVLVIINQRNFNTPVFPLGKKVRWAGLLVSTDNQKTWTRFFVVNSWPKPSAKDAGRGPNVIQVLLERGGLRMDIADDRGGGSGEGYLRKFFSWNGGRSWLKGGCYYSIHDVGRITLQPVSKNESGCKLLDQDLAKNR